MIVPVPGDYVLHIMDHALKIPSDLDFTKDDKEVQARGDIPMRGWLTTEKMNAYRQIVHNSTFDHKDGLTFWNGRILKEHGRQFLTGGGDGTPIGTMKEHSFVKGKGMAGKGYFYKENPELFKRALHEKTIDAFSIGFRLLEGGAERRQKKGEEEILHITKGQLFEVSVVNIGANSESFFKILHSLRPEPEHLTHGYLYVIAGGARYLINRQGDIIDG